MMYLIIACAMYLGVTLIFLTNTVIMGSSNGLLVSAWNNSRILGIVIISVCMVASSLMWGSVLFVSISKRLNVRHKYKGE